MNATPLLLDSKDLARVPKLPGDRQPTERPTTEQVCRELLRPLDEIYWLHDSNGPYQDQVYMAIAATGMSIDNMTIRQLRELLVIENDKYNRGQS